jgi:hypothetical protein
VNATVSSRRVIPVTAVGGSMGGRAGLTFMGGSLILSGGTAEYGLSDAVGRRVYPEQRMLLP